MLFEWKLLRRKFRNGQRRVAMEIDGIPEAGFTSGHSSVSQESNVIGMGATGTVYKAEMPRLNTVVAVKKLWRSGTDIQTGSSDDFVGEVNLLGKLRHRNIVRLLGFLHNDTDIMIVYEYMPNGNLGEALHVSMVAGSYGYIAPGRPLEEALDKNVGNCNHVREEMLLVLRIALLCTAKLPKERPSMRDVITMLGEAKPRRKSSGNSSEYNRNKDKPVLSTSPVNGLV
ncbi:hypothetical protein GH714_025097 [Hevea brasiliensis]|uniref:Protein kinase domain-containing protein n=1 Tax=Hevea brasiliensis TaxID=3981 RepID=A0A6A6M459_HEVBR|nr:hypothetical protein GH714_025097 [Hevea brasiliensis]